jgi:hypothetical protein
VWPIVPALCKRINTRGRFCCQNTTPQQQHNKRRSNNKRNHTHQHKGESLTVGQHMVPFPDEAIEPSLLEPEFVSSFVVVLHNNKKKHLERLVNTAMTRVKKEYQKVS